MVVRLPQKKTKQIAALASVPFSRQAAMFEPPSNMVEEAWQWLSSAYSGMCLRKLRSFGFATPQQIIAARALLQGQIARIAKDLAEYKNVKDVRQEAEVSGRLAPNYAKPFVFIRQYDSGKLLHQKIRVDTSSPVWWNAFSEKGESVGGSNPPKFLAALQKMMERSLAGLQTASRPAVLEMVRLSERLKHLSSGIEFPLTTQRNVFNIDVTNWPYGTVVPDNWVSYTLMLSPENNPHASGIWQSEARTIIGYLGSYLEPQSRAEFEENRHELRTTLEHELVHFSQSLLKAMRVLKEEPGLVSRRIRPSKIFDIYGRPPGWEGMSPKERQEWEEEHALQEIEFQPRLRDEVRAFRRVASRLRRDLRRLLLRAWILPPEKSEPAEPIPAEWWKVIKLVKSSGFFDTLYWKERAKWRDAATKFIKSVEDLL